MRMSTQFGLTLRTAPGKTEAEGHQMLVRAGFVRQLGQGIFYYLPLGWRSVRKIEDILRQEMDAVGGQELSLPVVHPAEPMSVPCGDGVAFGFGAASSDWAEEATPAPTLAALRAKHRIERYTVIREEFDHLASGYIVNTLRQLGWSPRLDEEAT